MPGDRTAADEWRAAYERVSDLACDAGDDGLSVIVPSTPDWTAKDLLAHMVGVGVDATEGKVPDDLNPEWTQGHVDARSEVSMEGLIHEWSGKADEIERFVAETDASPLGDVVIHEQDLRGALEKPGAQDTQGLAIVREQMLGMFSDALGDAPALELRADDTDWVWRSQDGEPDTVVQASRYDLTRAVLSRRTADQLRSWTLHGDVAPYLDAFAHLGPLPEQPLPGEGPPHAA